MKKNTRRAIKAVLYLLVALFVFASFGDFRFFIYKNAKAQNEIQLQEIALQTAASMQLHMKNSLQLVENAAYACSALPKDNAAMQELLQKICSNSSFNRMWVSNLAGDAISDTGIRANTKALPYFQAAMAGKSGITNAMNSWYNEEKILIVYAPIYSQGEISGVLHATYVLNRFSESFKISLFQGEGYVYILQKNGDILLAPENKNALCSEENLLRFLSTVKYTTGSFDELKQNLEKKESGALTFQTEAHERFAYYTPIQINDWYIMEIVPQQVVAATLETSKMAGVWLTVKLFAFFLLIILSIIYFERQSQQTIAAAYQELSFINSNLPGGVLKCTADNHYRFVYMSDGFLKLLGYNRSEIREKFHNRFLETVHPDSREKTLCEIKKNANKPGTTVLKCRLLTKDGRLLWVSGHCQLTTEDGRPYYYCSILDITESVRAEKALRVSYEKYRIALAQTENAVFEYNTRTKEANFAPETLTQCGFYQKLDGIPDGLLCSGLLHPNSKTEFLDAQQKIAAGAPDSLCEVRIHMPDDTYTWQKISFINIFDEAGNVLQTIGVIKDITKEKETALHLCEEEKYRTVILAEAIFVYEFNLSTGKTVSEYVTETMRDDLYAINRYIFTKTDLDKIHPNDRGKVREAFCVENMWNAYYSASPEIRLQYRIRTRHGVWQWIETTIHFMQDALSNQVKGMAYAKNIDEQMKKELALQSQAERDSLTGLYNRATAKRKMNQLLSNGDALLETAAFFILDIDYFKNINDTAGHAVGDAILKKIAALLNSEVRKTDVIGRLGGDEFVILLNNLRNGELAPVKAREICEAVQKMDVEDSYTGGISVSIGIALATEDGASFDELYQKADLALYEAKKDGRNAYRMYEKNFK